MRTFIKTALFLAAALPCLASAATYQWRDDAGVLHFTDDADRIPDRYLKRATQSDTDDAGKAKAPEQKKQETPTAPAAAAADNSAARPVAGERARLEGELKQLQAGLALKKKELERLKHRWTVSKGRTPTEKEVAEYEKKRAKGKVTFADNPYVNKNPLSSTTAARLAYYKKLEEVQKDEEHASRLEQELEALR